MQYAGYLLQTVTNRYAAEKLLTIISLELFPQSINYGDYP